MFAVSIETVEFQIPVGYILTMNSYILIFYLSSFQIPVGYILTQDKNAIGFYTKEFQIPVGYILTFSLQDMHISFFGFKSLWDIF